MHKHALKIVLASIIGLTGNAFAQSGADVSRPNILFILADDQGWNHLSVPMHDDISGSGSDYFQTPNIERIAEAEWATGLARLFEHLPGGLQAAEVLRYRGTPSFRYRRGPAGTARPRRTNARARGSVALAPDELPGRGQRDDSGPIVVDARGRSWRCDGYGHGGYARRTSGIMRNCPACAAAGDFKEYAIGEKW